MRRSIFFRVSAILMAVLFIGISITGAVFWFFMEQRALDEKSSQLRLSGERIVDTLEIYLQNQENVLAPLLFRSLLDSMERTEASIVWIVLDDGTLAVTTDLPEWVLEKLEITEDGKFKLIDERQYSSSQGAEGDSIRGDFFGLFSGSGFDWLTVRIPFSHERTFPRGFSIQGNVLLHAQMPDVQAARNEVVRLFIVSSIAGILVSLFLGFFFSRQLSAPLKQMSQTARRISSGQFSERIIIRSQDEFGQLAISFNEMVEALSQLERVRRDFVGSVSHELRTPLTSMKGFVDGIIDGTVPAERQKDCLLIVRDETHRMHRMVNDLLDLTKMEAGGVGLVMEIFDLCEMIRICVISLQQQLIEKSLEFEADFENERMYTKADRDSIQRLLLNLLQNAIKFTPNGGNIRVSVRSQRDKLEVSVIDWGIGISTEELPFVFDRFYKTDKSRSTDRTGVGIGLAIVRSIILAHHEEIKVSSNKEDGTIFTFTLPEASEAVPFKG